MFYSLWLEELEKIIIVDLYIALFDMSWSILTEIILRNIF